MKAAALENIIFRIEEWINQNIAQQFSWRREWKFKWFSFFKTNKAWAFAFIHRMKIIVRMNSLGYKQIAKVNN